MSTAGGLVFKGQVDGNLVALDAKTGDQLWSFQTGLPISAPPMTWADSKGDQYVTVAVGGNRGGLTTLDGDEVWVNEVNTIPGSMAKYLWVEPKVEFVELIDAMLDEAVARPTTHWSTEGADGTALRSAGSIAGKLG